MVLKSRSTFVSARSSLTIYEFVFSPILQYNFFVFFSTKWYGEYLTTYHYKMQDVLANAELVKCEELCFYTPVK